MLKIKYLCKHRTMFHIFNCFKIIDIVLLELRPIMIFYNLFIIYIKLFNIMHYFIVTTNHQLYVINVQLKVVFCFVFFFTFLSYHLRVGHLSIV